MRPRLRMPSAWFPAGLLALCCGLPAAQGQNDPLRVPVKDSPGLAKKALVIGVGAYTKARELRFTVNDAKKFAAFLVQKWGFSEDQIFLMTDDAPSRTMTPTFTNVGDQVDAFLKSTNKDSEVVVFFSGHGIREKDQDYLVPLDGNPEKIARTCISATDLRNQLEGKKPRRALLFLDACRDLADTKGRSVSRFADPAAPPGAPQMAALFSCEPGETSREGRAEHFSMGVFTKFLLDGLNGVRDAATEEGEVTFDSLQQFVRAKVYSYVQRVYASAQTPFGLSSTGSMLLTRAFDPPKKMAEMMVAEGKIEARNLVDKAHILLLASQKLQAREKALEALKKDPENANAHFIIGVVALENNELDEAIKALSTAKQLDPTLIGLDERLAEAGKRKMGSAPAVMVNAAQQAELLLQQGQLKPAETQASVVLYVEMNASNADKALALSVLGRIYEASQPPEPDKARKAFQEALGLQPDLKQALEGSARLKMLPKKSDVGAVINEALQLLSEGKLLNAELKAREVLDQEPDNPRAHYVLGRVFFTQNNFDRAKQEFQAAAAKDPTYADARTALEDVEVRLAEKLVLALAKRAEQLLAQEQYAQAEMQATDVLARRTQNVGANGLANFVLGKVYENAKRFGEALRSYQEALRLEPGRDEARKGVDRMAKALGQVDIQRLIAEAAEQLQANKLNEAEAKARQAIAQAPENAAGHFVLGQVYATRGEERYEDALREYQEARRLDATLPDVEFAVEQVRKRKNQSDSRKLAVDSYQHLTRAEFVEAVSKARRALQLDEKNAKAHAVVGAALISMNDEKSAEPSIREALRLDDKSSLGYVAEGIVIYQQFVKKQKFPESFKTPIEPEMLDRAIAKWRQAVTVREDEILAFNNLGAALEFQGGVLQNNGKAAEANQKFTSAVQSYEQAIRLQGDFPIAHFNLGNTRMWLNQFDGAERAYREAIRLYDKNGRFHLALAVALAMQKRLPDAEAEARLAVSMGILTSDPLFDLLRQKGVRLPR